LFWCSRAVHLRIADRPRRPSREASHFIDPEAERSTYKLGPSNGLYSSNFGALQQDLLQRTNKMQLFDYSMLFEKARIA
jgi:hypothetical protein